MTTHRILPALWQSLQDTTWHLHRTLRSINTAEPSGTCTGKANFRSRTPAVFVDKDGKLQLASYEMLYTEEGSFQMTNSVSKSAAFTFSRKYIWRLRDDVSQPPEISIWFTKPGTEDIDYLFHTFVVQRVNKTKGTPDGQATIEAECSGGHLCVEDYYSSSYTFSGTKTENNGESKINVDSWNMHHDVRGPKKDQSIETNFKEGINTSDHA